MLPTDYKPIVPWIYALIYCLESFYNPLVSWVVITKTALHDLLLYASSVMFSFTGYKTVPPTPMLQVLLEAIYLQADLL